MRCHVALSLTLASVVAVACRTEPTPQAAQPPTGGIDRSVLPIARPVTPTITTLDARNATAPPPFAVTAPKGAPNVVYVLIDDMGFGAPSTFGGAIPMPVMDSLANAGLRYNSFHTTALCSPTRMAILTGRNHHTVNTGAIMEIATAYTGNTGIRPLETTPFAEILRQNGYSTAAFGKYHETPPWEVSVSGSYDRWPTHSGFDKFYGFIGGEANQYSPLLFDGTTMVEPSRDPKYHVTVDLTNHAIQWMQAQHSMTPDKPFFVYFATGATHAPHQVPREWIDKFKGQFDEGWDAYREKALARQIKLGIVPAGTKLAPRPEAIKAWNALSPVERKVFARQMEVYAGFAAQTDYEIGRLLGALREMGVADNTLVFYEAGDNGASAEGGLAGMLNEMTVFNGVAEDVNNIAKHLDELGGPNSFSHFAAGWAVATDAPFEWTKQIAGSYGGTQNPLVISWPARIKAHGEIRPQWSHVTDIAPTVLEAANVPQPRTVNGVTQAPMDGFSLVYSFDSASAKTHHNTQYFEILGNRGIYHDGWMAGAVHRMPWQTVAPHPVGEDVWELYHADSDFSLSTNVAKENPAKLKEMQDLFMSEAVKYHVLPIDDRSIERFDASLAGRPDLMGGRTSLTVYPGMHGIMENAFINVKNRSVDITAEIEVPKGGGDGVILAQGGQFGGWSIYVKNNRPVYYYNYLGLERMSVRATEPLPSGKVTLRYAFLYDGGRPGAGGTLMIYVNGKKVGSGKIAKTQPYVFSMDDATDVGMDEGTPVSTEYGKWDNGYRGTIKSVTVKTSAVALTAEQVKALEQLEDDDAVSID
jgi:arylsulfatase